MSNILINIENKAEYDFELIRNAAFHLIEKLLSLKHPVESVRIVSHSPSGTESQQIIVRSAPVATEPVPAPSQLVVEEPVNQAVAPVAQVPVTPETPSATTPA